MPFRADDPDATVIRPVRDASTAARTVQRESPQVPVPRIEGGPPSHGAQGGSPTVADGEPAARPRRAALVVSVAAISALALGAVWWTIQRPGSESPGPAREAPARSRRRRRPRAASRRRLAEHDRLEGRCAVDPACGFRDSGAIRPERDGGGAAAARPSCAFRDRGPTRPGSQAARAAAGEEARAAGRSGAGGLVVRSRRMRPHLPAAFARREQPRAGRPVEDAEVPIASSSPLTKDAPSRRCPNPHRGHNRAAQKSRGRRCRD